MASTLRDVIAAAEAAAAEAAAFGGTNDAIVAGLLDAGPLTKASIAATIDTAFDEATYAPSVERGLRSFHAALGQRHDTPVRILGLGHSFLEGQGASANGKRWWERFQQVMRQRFPLFDGSTPTGRGFIPAFYKAATMTDPVIGGAGGATVEVNTMGLGGRTLYMPVGRTLTFALTGTTVRVWFVGGTATGTLNVTIDGTPQTPINTVRPSNQDGQWTEFSMGAAGAHTVVITAASAACYVAGVEEFNGNESKGFQINEAGHSGFKASDFIAINSSGGGGFNSLWNLPDADLYIVEFGINEWVAGSVTPTSFRTSLNGIVEAIRNNAPLASILFIADYQDLGTYTHTWQEFVAVYDEKAATDPDIAVLDMTKRMPTASTAAAGLGLSTSDGHPSDKGHMAYAQQVAEFITPR